MANQKKKKKAEKQFKQDVKTWKARLDKVLDYIDKIGVRTRRVSRRDENGNQVDGVVKRHRVSLKTLKVYLADRTVRLPEIDSPAKQALLDYAADKKIILTTANYTVVTPQSVDDLDSMITKENRNRGQALYFQPHGTERYGNRSSGNNQVDVDDLDDLDDNDDDNDNESTDDDESTDESTDDTDE